MRNILITMSDTVVTAASPDLVKSGIAAYYFKDDVLTQLPSDGSVTGLENVILVMDSGNSNVSNTMVSLSKPKYSAVTGIYSAATRFKATLTVSAPTVVGEYGIRVSKKGVGLNERSNYSFTTNICNLSVGVQGLVDAFVNLINTNTISARVTAKNESNKLVIEGVYDGEDFSVGFIDGTNGSIDSVTPGKMGYGDYVHVNDLFSKCVGDKGILYTYETDMYPTYPMGSAIAESYRTMKMDVTTFTFAEPRKDRTVDELIAQKVQLVYPTAGTNVKALIEAITTALK